VSVGLLTAGSGQTWENELVAALDRPGAPLSVVRRCVDIADVLAEATTGRAAAVVISSDLRRLDTEAVERLQLAGVVVIAVHPASDTRAAARLERIGIHHVVSDDAGPDVLVAAARSALLDGPDEVSAVGLSDPRVALRQVIPDEPPVTEEPPGDADPTGSVIAVWGPTGAPGRTTVAMGLAVAAAEAGVRTLLVDGDVYGGVLASAFGLLDESPGLAGACRAAANGRLDAAELGRLQWSLTPALRLLTGIGRPDRWPEIRPSAIPAVLGMARSTAALTVVDCGFALETDEEITFDTMAPRRNGATLALLAEADLVLAVGSADPPGVERLVRGLGELSDHVPTARTRVVLNRLRRSAASESEAEDAIRRFTGHGVLRSLPEDRAAADKAWQRGVALVRAAPASPLTNALATLSGDVLAQLRTATAAA
jgi:MinD-like ATPase involved in chromosome partitioning or flagellar assembly